MLRVIGIIYPIIYSMDNGRDAISLSNEALADLIGSKIQAVRPLYGGSNSVTCEIIAVAGSKFVIKQYLGQTADGRSRLDIEYQALEFLSKQGIDQIPKPIVKYKPAECAIYQFLEGDRLSAGDISVNDVDHAVDFLIKLHELSKHADSVNLPIAAEACFSLLDLIKNVEERIGNLTQVHVEAESGRLFREFLHDELLPSWDLIRDWAFNTYHSANMDVSISISNGQKTLSPSDFGFHNCLKNESGELCFLDFEYFGWDDPIKLLSDFLLHPGMDLSEPLKYRFMNRAVLGLGCESSGVRFNALYPIFALKWCLIMLNCFLNPRLPKNDYRVIDESTLETTRVVQLQKAENSLSKIQKIYNNIPYWQDDYAKR